MTQLLEHPARVGTAVGSSVDRVDAREKLRGSAEYTGDLHPPSMLYGAVLRSQYAHAEIESIDTSSAATRMPTISMAAVLAGPRATLTGVSMSKCQPLPL